ncbi:MAG: GNAT family N-acetyltransferase [Sphingobacteriaceae bacterium]
MYKAEYCDKGIVVDILTRANDTNPGANLIIKQDQKRVLRLSKLMAHIFDVCYLFGEVFLSKDKKACALVLYPEKRKGSIKSILLDIKLVFQCIGFRNIFKILSSEKARKKIRPKSPISYLWNIGVDPQYQRKGLGSFLMEEVTRHSFSQQRPIYFEAMIPHNISWYKKMGFTLYHEEHLVQKVSFFKKDMPV